MPDDAKDAQETVPTVCTVWQDFGLYSFSPFPESPRYSVVVPFGWAPAIDPVKGVCLRSLWDNGPVYGPREAPAAARLGLHGFRLADDTKERG